MSLDGQEYRDPESGVREPRPGPGSDRIPDHGSINP